MKSLLSVVVPCYNEAEVLWETHSRLVGVLGRLPDIEFEIIYVDDGSQDGTADVMHDIQAIDPRVRTIRFSRNFGHQTAVTAGLEHAKGDAVVLIDADLQDPPDVIAEMVARWREGYHVAYGVRTDREGETKFKLATAKLFYRVLNRLSETEIPLDTGDFRLMDRTVVNALRAMPERDRFVRGMVAWAGFDQIAVPYRRAARFAGESKYPLFKMIRFALDGVTSFSRAPLRAATWLGFIVSAVALTAIVYALVMRLFTDDWVTGWTALFIAVLFVGGAQLLSLGIIGEYVGRIYGEAKGRPLYIVQEAHGFDGVVAHAALQPRRVVHDDDARQPRAPRDDLGPRRAYRETEPPVPVFHEPPPRVDESVA
jgi:glycosyltransferase involved in cell wall biosynthesis